MNANIVKYKVYADKGIVVAIIRPGTCDAINEFNKKYMAQTTAGIELDFGWNKASDHFAMPAKLTAVAKCHPEDTFNEELGKRIAFNKLRKKYNESMNKRLYKILTCLHKSVKLLDADLEGRDF